MRRLYIWCLYLAFASGAVGQPRHSHTSADEALARLRTGNRQYVAGNSGPARIGAAARVAVKDAQHPFATVLTCADSRVPPEAIFSQGLGDLFVVRVAGAVPDQAVLGSIEYAAEHLHVPLVVVMGHFGCGAVKSAMEWSPIGPPDPAHANLERILSAIRPSLAHARHGGDAWADAVRASVDQNIQDALRLSPVLSELAETGKVKLTGAIYDLATGEVEFSEPPFPHTAAHRGR